MTILFNNYIIKLKRKKINSDNLIENFKFIESLKYYKNLSESF